VRFKTVVVDDSFAHRRYHNAYQPIASLHPKGISERELTGEERAHFEALTTNGRLVTRKQ
jgi:hypothetical protein